MKPRKKSAARSATDSRAARRTAAQIAQEVLARKRLQREREIALMDAGVKKVDIERTLKSEGIVVSHTTVSSVIAGTFRNKDVERVFCALTGSDPLVMFPAWPSVSAPAAATT